MTASRSRAVSICRTLYVAKIASIGSTTLTAAVEIRVPNRGMRQTVVLMVRCVMSRYIDANELISAMYYYEHNEGGLTAYDAQDIINKAPTIEPKRGEWISKHNGYWTCSECGLSFLFYAKGNFCPNCGADMREREGE